MSRIAAVLALALALAAPAEAREPVLRFPVDCVLGETCHVQHHVDRDPGPGAADFTCGRLTYDTHDGTDIALPSLAAMQAGVDVVAAAPGRVLATRDGVPDIAHGDPDAPEIDGQECGNGIVVDHGGGWQTQYCHMKRGSVVVRKGRRVAAGTTLGQIGLSGLTQFPHLHFTVRRDGDVIDPYSSDILPLQCGVAPARTLWRDPIPYTEAGLIAAGFAAAVPDYADVKAGTATASTLPADAPALVLWGFAFGGQPGDRLRVEIRGPAGPLLEKTVALDEAQVQYFRALGKRRPPGGWPAGDYTGTVTLVRAGATLDTHTASVVLGR